MPKQKVEGTRGGEREREKGAPERGRGYRQNQREEGAGSYCTGEESLVSFFFFLPEKKKEKEEKHEAGRTAFSFFFFSFFFLPEGGEKKKQSTRKTIRMKEKIKHDTKIKATWRERECPVSMGLSWQAGSPPSTLSHEPGRDERTGA